MKMYDLFVDGKGLFRLTRCVDFSRNLGESLGNFDKKNLELWKIHVSFDSKNSRNVLSTIRFQRFIYIYIKILSLSQVESSKRLKDDRKSLIIRIISLLNYFSRQFPPIFLEIVLKRRVKNSSGNNS